jgi:putative pyruvate formate lyase activating enzyme
MRVQKSWQSNPNSHPSYLALFQSGELNSRASALLELLASCHVCPRNCRVKRLMDRRAVCETGRFAATAWHGIAREHIPCDRGGMYPGTVVFAHSNLSGVFSFAWVPDLHGGAKSVEDLADIYLELQEQGARHLEWVSPSHVVPQAVEALVLAAGRGLRLPLIYASSGYDSIETLRLLEGIVDIYLPELLPVASDSTPALSQALGYGSNAIAAIGEMWRQVGPPQFDGDDTLVQGLVVRLCSEEADARAIAESLRLLRSELGGDPVIAHAPPQRHIY